MSTSLRISWILALSGTLAILAGVGCASAPKRPNETKPAYGPPISKPAEPYGPEPAPDQSTVGPQPPANYGPQPDSVRPIVLVLGPGMARGLAHIGAIRALTDARIPIAAVIGTEMGGLAGALYASDGKANRLDWLVTRIKPAEFREARGRSGGILGGRDELTADLKKIFGAQDLARGKIPVRIGLENLSSGEPFIAESGSSAEAARAGLSDEVHPFNGWKGGKACSSSRKKPVLVPEARALGLGPVVLIDTAGSTTSDSGADLVVRPELKGIGDDEFEKKTEIIFRGKTAVAAKLDELRSLTGTKKGSGS